MGAGQNATAKWSQKKVCCQQKSPQSRTRGCTSNSPALKMTHRALLLSRITVVDIDTTRCNRFIVTPKTTRFSKRLQGHCVTSSGSCIVVRSLQAVQAFPRQFYRVCGGVLKIENVSLPPLQLKMDLDLAHRDRCRPRPSRSHTTLFQPDPCPPVAAGRSFRRTSQLRCRHKPRPAVGIGTLIARNERAPCPSPTGIRSQH